MQDSTCHPGTWDGRPLHAQGPARTHRGVRPGTGRFSSSAPVNLSCTGPSFTPLFRQAWLTNIFWEQAVGPGEPDFGENLRGRGAWRPAISRARPARTLHAPAVTGTCSRPDGAESPSADGSGGDAYQGARGASRGWLGNFGKACGRVPRPVLAGEARCQPRPHANPWRLHTGL